MADCISAVWRGDTESDTLNRLVLAAGLDWRQIEILRAYRKYRQRIGSRFTESYQNDVLVENAAVTARPRRAVRAALRPRARARRGRRGGAAEHDPDARSTHVESLDHDRILRNQLGLIEATLRTNAYRRGRGAMSFKLRSADVPAMPEPAPLVEIYVYSAEMEGIHLRGGRIARGGIRWSDRMDYRTEVYGLMRAQLTKNAQIVPEGAKGGFYLKHRPSDPSELREEVQRQYVAYVRGLLDVTDNLVDGEVVHPPDTRVLDEADTYLVVAADKGTATFSDTANKVAEDYGFWLGDAFASGGSSGYDHKKLGITARGAWESVKRHFLELELDVAKDPFTVVGHRRHVGRRVRQRDAAVGPHPPGRRLRPPPHLHRPRSGPGRRASPSGSGCSGSPARRGTTTTARRSPRAAACGRARPSGSRCRRRRSARWGSRTTRWRPTT